MRIYKKGEQVRTADDRYVTVTDVVTMAHPTTKGKLTALYRTVDSKGREETLRDQDVRNIPKDVVTKKK